MKKPSLAVLLAGKDDEGAEDMSESDAALDELASVLGVSEDQADAFKEAFRAAVAAEK